MARLTKIITVLFISLISFQAQAKNPPPGTGTADIPANILIMLDNSGSMGTKLYASVQVYYPLDVATDSSGNVYVMEYYNNRIKVFDSSGAYLRSFGGYGNSCNRWSYARQFTIYNDEIYIADTYNYRVKKLNLNGGCIANIYLGTHKGAPHAIAVSANFWAVGFTNGAIYLYNRSSFYSRLRDYGFNTNYLHYSWGMSFNNAGNKLLVADYYKNRLIELNVSSGAKLSHSQVSSGTSMYGTGSYSTSNGYFRRPMDAAYDSSGNIYALDLYGHRLQKFNSSLTYQAKTGTWSTSSGFRYPYGMHIDSSDNIYVTDFYNYAVRKYNTSLTETATYGGGAGTRLDAAKKVIKQIVSNTDLTSGANFGLMEWGTRHKIRVYIKDTGARTIYTNVDGVYAGGGTDLFTAMKNARKYFKHGHNGVFVDNWNLPCSINYLIVISDGHWGNHGSVINIANQLRTLTPAPIKTFAVGFALGGASSNYSTLATAGGTVKPLYASNASELLAKLTDAIKQAISGRLTFTTPAVMSDITKGNFVYQSTFEYEKNKQWEGSLKKYKLNSDGSFGGVQWDAGDKLNAKSASSRKIWTTGISTTSTNNFTTTYRDDLKSLLFPSQSPTDTEVENLINFIRGVDTYDQDADNNKTESIHKLADIYHSELIVVGAPDAPASSDDGSSNSQKKDSYYRSQNNYDSFKNGASCGGPCKNRTEIILAGANNGILHAFDVSNGEELWGYIPPNVLGNLEKIPSSKANSTNAIYGIDGSPVVKDIYFDDTPNDSTDNPRWRTVLLGGLGAGGKGLYAIDITDVNNPTHLFAVSNNESDKAIQHWNIDGLKQEFGYAGGSSIDAKYDYRKLGETWSTPRIIRIKVSGKDKWVAVFGGGYNGAVNPNVGSAVFVMDLEDEGRLLKVIDIVDTSADIINSLPADLSVITADGTNKANYNGAMIYATDLEGKITKINLTDQGTLYQSTTLFTAESTSANGRYIYTRPEVTINNDNNLWLYFGTGSTQKLQAQSSQIKNRLYGIKDKNFPNFVTVSSPGNVSKCKTAPTCPGGTDLGWYVDLKKSQKLTAEPTIDKDRVYFPIYEPDTTSACKTGNAILTGYDSKCGNSVLNVNMGKGVLSKVVKQGDNLYIGLAGEVNKNIAGFTSKDNLITGKSKALSSSGSVQLEYWKENY